MIRKILFLGIMLFLSTITFAQSPESFKYQAVARDASGQVLMNQAVGFRISVLEGGTTGSSVYTETHAAATNDFGLVNLAIGSGAVVSGDFTGIDWGTDTYFLQIEMDETGGTNYQTLGTSQLLSVPYALHAKTADSVPGDSDTDDTNEIQSLSIAESNLTLSNGGGTVALPPDSDDQTLDLTGTSLSIENGNAIDMSVLQDGVIDADADPGNEIQNLSLAGNILELSGANTVDLSVIQDGLNDADADPNNEIQNLSLNGTTLEISGGNTIDLSVIQDGVTDADADPNNELQNLSLTGTSLEISNGNSIDLAVLQDGVNDADADPTNEIQALTLTDNSLMISGSNTVDLSDVGPDPLWSQTGADIFYNSGNIGVNTDAPEFDFQVNGELFVNSSAGRLNIGLPDNGNQWRFSTQGSGANLQLQSKPSGIATYTRRVYFADNGNVAIGNNSNPDEELVIGSNLGSGWGIPAVTVGGSFGGVFQAGNEDYKISMESSSTFNRARIISSSAAGFGKGETEMRTNGLSIGDNPGSPGSFMLKVVHGSFGVNFQRAGTNNDWEFLTSSASASNLNLYANGAFRGAFSGVDGDYNASSDRRLKRDIQKLEAVLPKVLQLKPSRYEYKDNNPKNIQSIGFIAQEVQQQFPELVHVVEDERSQGMMALKYSGFGVLAIKAIQEQEEKIQVQSAKIENQQQEIDELKARLAQIEALLNK